MIVKIILPIVSTPEDVELAKFLTDGYTIIHSGNMIGGDNRTYVIFVLYRA